MSASWDVGQSTAKRQKALVVDDEPVVGQIMCRVLEQMGYEADHALDGQQALQLVRENPYAIAICDILMPRVNGMALYEAWKQEAPELTTRTIFITGDSLGKEVGDFIRGTGCPCVYKPFQLIELVSVINRVLAANPVGPALS